MGAPGSCRRGLHCGNEKVKIGVCEYICKCITEISKHGLIKERNIS
jgi:hypothetical protein